MYPVLIVEGVAHAVVAVNFRDKQPSDVQINENGKYVTYYDKNHGLYAGQVKVIDLSKHLKWIGRYELLAQELINRVEGKEEILASLENQYMVMAKQKKCLPYPNEELDDVMNQHDTLENEINGMSETIGILDELRMQEGFELEGEEVER